MPFERYPLLLHSFQNKVNILNAKLASIKLTPKLVSDLTQISFLFTQRNLHHKPLLVYTLIDSTKTDFIQ